MLIGCKRVPVMTHRSWPRMVYVHVTYARTEQSAVLDIFDYWINPDMAKFFDFVEQTQFFAVAKGRVETALKLQLDNHPDVVKVWGNEVVYG